MPLLLRLLLLRQRPLHRFLGCGLKAPSCLMALQLTACWLLLLLLLQWRQDWWLLLLQLSPCQLLLFLLQLLL